jgi:hypothetical protein
MSLAYVKRGTVASATVPRLFFYPEAGRVMGSNGDRMHIWEVEPAPGEPFGLSAHNASKAVLDDIDFLDDGWATPVEPELRGFSDKAASLTDEVVAAAVVWRATTVGALREALASARRRETWVLDASTPSLFLMRVVNAEGEAVPDDEPGYDIGLGDGEVPDPAFQQFRIDGKYLRDALIGSKDNVVYLGWPADPYAGPLVVLFDEQPYWAMIMGIKR